MFVLRATFEADERFGPPAVVHGQRCVLLRSPWYHEANRHQGRVLYYLGPASRPMSSGPQASGFTKPAWPGVWSSLGRKPNPSSLSQSVAGLAGF